MTIKTFVMRLCLAAVAATGTAAMAANAATPGTGNGELAVCKPDIEKLCPGIQPGEGRLKACVKEHRKDLSPECKKALAAQRKSAKS